MIDETRFPSNWVQACIVSNSGIVLIDYLKAVLCVAYLTREICNHGNHNETFLYLEAEKEMDIT